MTSFIRSEVNQCPVWLKGMAVASENSA